MEYNEKVIFLKQLINSALSAINQYPLFENKDFELLKSTKHYKDYIVLSLVRKGTIPLFFWLECGDLRIDIDRTEETYSWDSDFIKENKQYVINLLTMIFTCSIKVEHCGKHYTKLYFINSQGIVLNTMKYTDALFAFRRNCKEKVYPPIYPSSKIYFTEPILP